MSDIEFSQTWFNSIYKGSVRPKGKIEKSCVFESVTVSMGTSALKTSDQSESLFYLTLWKLFSLLKMDKYLKIRQNLLKKSIKQPEGTKGCIFWGKGLTKDGYGRVRNPFQKKGEIHAHRLMYMVSTECDSLPEKDPLGRILHVSHLCHQKRCINIDHLVLEPHCVNNERTTCATQGACNKRHMPPCIF